MIKENFKNRFSSKIKPYLMVHVLVVIILLALVFSMTNLNNLPRNLLILLLVLALPAYAFIILVYNHWSYSIRNNDITINSGIIFKESKTIALSAILHISQKKGPLMSLFGLTTVGLWTAAPSQIKVTNGNSINSADAVIYLSTDEARELQVYIDAFRQQKLA